jgi:hypothetical protein
MKVSISRIKAFKSCRRMYELRYIEGLIPVETSDSLQIGSNYHKLLEELNTNGHHWDYVEYSKAMAMAQAYYKYIYPRFHVTEAEKHLEMDLGNGDILHGYVDAIADDGHIVEHKTVGSDITEQYEYNLQWDEQILAYMLLTGKRKVWYTVCRRPTIRQKQNESDEEFYNRMVEWYDTDTDSKIRLLEIERTDDEVEAFKVELMRMIDDMRHASHFYKNTCHCNMYGRRCEYSSICLHYDPNQQYLEFMKEGKTDGIEED